MRRSGSRTKLFLVLAWAAIPSGMAFAAEHAPAPGAATHAHGCHGKGHSADRAHAHGTPAPSAGGEVKEKHASTCGCSGSSDCTCKKGKCKCKKCPHRAKSRLVEPLRGRAESPLQPARTRTEARAGFFI